MDNVQRALGKLIKRQRLSLSLTLTDLALGSGVSASYLGRVERGERFPSGHVLSKIAKPLHFEEDELMVLAGYLKERPTVCEDEPGTPPQLDPLVRSLLSQETVETQRLAWAALEVMKVVVRDLSD